MNLNLEPATGQKLLCLGESSEYMEGAMCEVSCLRGLMFQQVNYPMDSSHSDHKEMQIKVPKPQKFFGDTAPLRRTVQQREVIFSLQLYLQIYACQALLWQPEKQHSAATLASKTTNKHRNTRSQGGRATSSPLRTKWGGGFCLSPQGAAWVTQGAQQSLSKFKFKAAHAMAASHHRGHNTRTADFSRSLLKAAATSAVFLQSKQNTNLVNSAGL